MTLRFNEEQKTQIRFSLEDHLGITDPAQQDLFINSIEETGKLRIFGYGSLLTYSHLQNADGSFKDKERLKNYNGLDTAGLEKELAAAMPSSLVGFERGFVCYDTFYRGTQETPGITLGLDRTESGETTGGVLDISLSDMDPNTAANFIAYNFEEFAKRESPPNMPIYKFAFEPVQLTNREEITALVCVADENGPLYIYNPENRYVQKDPAKYHLTLDNPAKTHAIMATAMGYPYTKDGSELRMKPKGAITNLDYVRNFIEDSFKKKIPVDPVYYATYANIIFARMKMPENEIRTIEEFERDGALANAPDIATKLLVSVGQHNQKINAENDNSSLELDETQPGTMG